MVFDAVFQRSAPRTLEIGFGNGASLALMANTLPEQDFIGIEVHRPGGSWLVISAIKSIDSDPFKKTTAAHTYR